MGLYDRIQTEMVDARMKRDGVALDTLSLLKSELVRASKDANAAGRIDDDLVVRIARKEVKRREEAIEVYRKAGREESARREEAEMAVLRGFLPASMSEQEIESEVRKVIAEVKPDGPKGFGLVMKAATSRLAGRADGNEIAKVTRRLLGS
ncbi:MAG TPA: GatB/YqeY domain-containing protein [Candidatus Dormibacteraeota bacterium]